VPAAGPLPGSGALVALTFRPSVDEPAGLTLSTNVVACVDRSASHNQSGGRVASGGNRCAGDLDLRRSLCRAATE